MDHADTAYFEDVTNSIRSAVFELLSKERDKLRRDHATIVATQNRSNPKVCTQVNCRHEGILLVPTNAFCHPSLKNTPLFNCGRNQRAPRDDEGRVFVDFAPEVVRFLLSFIATLHDDEAAAEPPSIPEALQKDWIDLLTMFKLTPQFFHKKSRKDWRSGNVIKGVSKQWRRVRKSDQETASSAHSGDSGGRSVPRASRMYCTPESAPQIASSHSRKDVDVRPARNSVNKRRVPSMRRHARERIARRNSAGSPRDGHTPPDVDSGADTTKRETKRDPGNGHAWLPAWATEGMEQSHATRVEAPDDQRRSREESRSSSGQRGSSQGSQRYLHEREQPSVNFEDVCRGKVNIRRSSSRIREVVASPGVPFVSKLK